MAAGDRKAHRARALLEQFGVGNSTIGDRQLTEAAYGNRALTVPAPNGRGTHAVWAHKGIGEVDQLAAELIKRERGARHQPSAEEIASGVAQLRAAAGGAYGDDAALLQQARLQQRLVGQAFRQRQEAVEQVIDLASENPNFRQQLLPYMGIDPAALNARPAAAGGDPAWVMEAARQQAYGAGASNADLQNAAVMDAVRQQAQGAGYSVASREAELREAALRAQLEDAQRMIDAAKVAPQPPPPATANAAASTPPPGGDAPAAAAAARTNANPEVIPPEVNNWWTATAPELKGIPVLKHIPNWGSVTAAGAGVAGAGALAYHLLMTGQQQRNNADYAAQVQAMNAY